MTEIEFLTRLILELMMRRVIIHSYLIERMGLEIHLNSIYPFNSVLIEILSESYYSTNFTDEKLKATKDLAT